MHPRHEQLIGDLAAGCREHYGARLVSVAVFGSLGRDAAGPESDVDLRTPAEIEAHSPLMLDRVDDARRAVADARFVLTIAESVIQPARPPPAPA